MNRGLLRSVGSTIAIFFLMVISSGTIHADQDPVGCVGSALNVNLFSDVSFADVGDTINYSVKIFNGLGVGPIACNASDIVLELVTPDGVTHNIPLARTLLASGESDFYADAVSYIAEASDIQPDNNYKAFAKTQGAIHQNIVHSIGGGQQGINVFAVPEFGLLGSVVALAGSAGSYLFIKLKNAG